MFINRPDGMGILQQSERLQHTPAIRKCVTECCNYINNHNGFTVCGSIARGEVQDASEQQSKVASEKVSYRICYSQATQLKVFERAEYKKLKFTYTMPLGNPAIAED